MLARLICWLTGHEYYVVQNFEPWSRRVACSRCKRSWGMHDIVMAFLPWDAEFEAMYRSFGHDIVEPWR